VSQAAPLTASEPAIDSPTVFQSSVSGALHKVPVNLSSVFSLLQLTSASPLWGAFRVTTSGDPGSVPTPQQLGGTGDPESVPTPQQLRGTGGPESVLTPRAMTNGQTSNTQIVPAADPRETMLEAPAAASRLELPPQEVGTLLTFGQYAHTFDEDAGLPFTTTAIGQDPYGCESLATLLKQDGASAQGWSAFHEDAKSPLSMTTMGQDLYANGPLAALSRGLEHSTLAGV
jgi:hypothetical protein